MERIWPYKEKLEEKPSSGHAQEKQNYVTFRLFILILKVKRQEGDKFTQYRIYAHSDYTKHTC